MFCQQLFLVFLQTTPIRYKRLGTL